MRDEGHERWTEYIPEAFDVGGGLETLNIMIHEGRRGLKLQDARNNVRRVLD